MKDKIVNTVQKQLLELTNYKFSKKYIISYIIPILDYIVFSNKKKFIISGSQGIGKSTLLYILEKNIKLYYNKNVLTLSLDDYYFNKNKRKQLSKNIHPLLFTRGVPGTHDVKNLLKTVKSFDNSSKNYILPVFDKIKDDVLNKTKKIILDADILILEGWCCGSPPLLKKYLQKNINILEKKMDKKMIWRNYYNNMLKKDYHNLFSKFDKIIYFKTPSFNFVFNWRMRQEKNLKTNNKKKMNRKEIKEFILYYEKITKWMMKILPNKADVVVHVNNKQKISKINYKK